MVRMRFTAIVNTPFRGEHSAFLNWTSTGTCFSMS